MAPLLILKSAESKSKKSCLFMHVCNNGKMRKCDMPRTDSTLLKRLKADIIGS